MFWESRLSAGALAYHTAPMENLMQVKRSKRGILQCPLAAVALVVLMAPSAGQAQSVEGVRPPARVLPDVVRPPARDVAPVKDAVVVPVVAQKATAAPNAVESMPEHVVTAAPDFALSGDPALYQVTTVPDTQLRIPYDVRPPARRAGIPRTRWQHMDGHAVWTRAALSALKDHGKPLVDIVPRDIAQWCPAYPTNTHAGRRAFWVGYMSALAKHESTYKPWAVGGGGRWYGLLQILPATARGYKCNVGTGEALKNGAANLSCAVRIMAFTVNRDGVIHGRDRKWRGVSADWGPMRKESKRRDMSNWLKKQSYCQMVNTVRPRARP